jgi:O-6-methylguanine DNA methyltransferase
MLRRTIESAFGRLVLLADDGRLQGVYFWDAADLPSTFAAHRRGSTTELAMPVTGGSVADRLVLDSAQAQLAAYALGQLDAFTLPLLERGTRFQQLIWQTLTAVPRGQSLSYGELARLAGLPRAVRAVGNAVGRNPWVIVVPCHRVLAAGQALGGFSSGLDRKRLLLRHEGIAWRESGVS